MTLEFIKDKLKDYKINTQEDESNALKEIIQEIALASLSRHNFFEEAMFQGGTSLRICHQLPRFSEDLDFILKAPNKNFKWTPYLNGMMEDFELYGIMPEVKDKSATEKNIKKMFLKDDSIGQQLELKFKNHIKRKLKIKIEVDINPPMGSNTETIYHDFPTDFLIVNQDLPSNFAGKCHALLCREYLKGRDWYDFSWYVAKKSISYSYQMP